MEKRNHGFKIGESRKKFPDFSAKKGIVWLKDQTTKNYL